MFRCKSSLRMWRRVWTVLIVFAASSGTAMAWLFCTGAYAQTPTPEENAIQSHNAAQSAICSLYGCNGSGGQRQRMIVGYDPCYLAQNAMRPCTSDQGQASKPVGVDPNLLGTWELPFKNGPWVLSILRDGTYRFHSEAGDGAPSHAGTFSASNGHWSLKATTGYIDTGLYLFQAPNIWIATGRLGAAAWLRPALAQTAMRPCTSDQEQASKPVGVDPNLLGTWELSFKGGPWVWEILRDGTYKFHSEARDGAPSHAGTFSASNGHWSLNATTGYTDTGLYLFQAPNIWIATGRLGAAAWLRPGTNTSCK
jgi:hypothetical protein